MFGSRKDHQDRMQSEREATFRQWQQESNERERRARLEEHARFMGITVEQYEAHLDNELRKYEESQRLQAKGVKRLQSGVYVYPSDYQEE